jgi:hypothetical protein
MLRSTTARSVPAATYRISVVRFAYKSCADDVLLLAFGIWKENMPLLFALLAFGNEINYHLLWFSVIAVLWLLASLRSLIHLLLRFARTYLDTCVNGLKIFIGSLQSERI